MLVGTDMTRKNLDGLNSSINRSGEKYNDDIPHSKINMYRFLEYNRPPATPSSKLRMRDNYMNHRAASPMSREANISHYLENQSVYSMEGSPIKESGPGFETLPPKSPSPQPPQMNLTGQMHYGGRN